MIDRYTKVVLTIIAACLVWNIATGNSVHRAMAWEGGPMHVIIDSVSSYALQFAGPLEVRVRQ